MIFEIYPNNQSGASVVRGFRDKEDENYIMVMTIFHNGDTATIHGFKSDGSLNPFELIGLWKFLKNSLKERFIECQVTFEHSRIYRDFLHISRSRTVQMFNGKIRDNLIIDMSKGIKHIYFNKGEIQHG